MARFGFHATPLSGLTVVQRKPIEDSRGFFARFFCADEFRQAGFSEPIAQINHTFSRKKGAVRGLHFQRSPYAETKVVSCLKGDIFDVAVDVRRGSPTFLNWHGEILSATNHRSILIPKGFAHGYQTLSDDCELVYLHSIRFHPESEGALNVNDPMLAIVWPLAITELSERDRAHFFIDADFEGVTT